MEHAFKDFYLADSEQIMQAGIIIRSIFYVLFSFTFAHYALKAPVGHWLTGGLRAGSRGVPSF